MHTGELQTAVDSGEKVCEAIEIYGQMVPLRPSKTYFLNRKADILPVGYKLRDSVRSLLSESLDQVCSRPIYNIFVLLTDFACCIAVTGKLQATGHWDVRNSSWHTSTSKHLVWTRNTTWAIAASHCPKWYSAYSSTVGNTVSPFAESLQYCD